MFFIGITGGVGGGKSEILKYLRENYNSRVMLTDEIAHEQMEPGTECYEQLKEVLGGYDVYEADGHFNRKALAKLLFKDEKLRRALNGIVHPAVDVYVDHAIKEERTRNQHDLLVIESALLIEKHFDEICDELWYIYTTEENRRERLVKSRNYSHEKINDIFRAQLSEAEFRKHCKVVIDNNGSVHNTFRQIRTELEKQGIYPLSEKNGIGR